MKHSLPTRTSPLRPTYTTGDLRHRVPHFRRSKPAIKNRSSPPHRRSSPQPAPHGKSARLSPGAGPQPGAPTPSRRVSGGSPPPMPCASSRPRRTCGGADHHGHLISPSETNGSAPMKPCFVKAARATSPSPVVPPSSPLAAVSFPLSETILARSSATRYQLLTASRRTVQLSTTSTTGPGAARGNRRLRRRSGAEWSAGKPRPSRE